MSSERKMNRVAVLAALGAEVHRLGIGYDDRDAWRGVLEMPLTEFTDASTSNDDIAELTLGAAISRMVAMDLGPLEGHGQAALFRRQQEAYNSDCARWAASPDDVKNGAWRSKPPTRPQRMMMMAISRSLGVPLPGDITRVEAQTWIDTHGGNPRYGQEG